ncbi:aldo/keto reductase [Pseudarthrobacter sp. YAF2]|uniref:aldo/keto reductase n=1 Tax=Pseudarthrobacter sp. YAF2 TaxID=3233078 RepID=UPI003F9D0213
MGTWGFGSGSAAAAQVGDDENLISVLQTAFEAGINMLDSADAYGNEERLGRLLKEVDVPKDLVIATKYGHNKPFGGAELRRSAEQSLKNLGLESLPIFMIHDPRGEEDMATILGPGGALEALRKLQEEGLVGAIGVATGTLAPLRLAVDSDEFDMIQFPRLYTLLNPAAATTGLLADAKAKGMATLNPAPFGGNILATGAVPNALYCYMPALPEVAQAVASMEERAAELNVPLAAAALGFSLTQPLVDATIIGVRNAAELRTNINTFGLAVSREELESIAAAGHVDEYFIGGPEYRSSWPPGHALPE